MNNLAREAIRTNPALESVRIVLEDYIEDALARRKQPPAAQAGGIHPASKPNDLPIVLLVGPDENIYMVLKLALHGIPHKMLWAQEETALSEALESHLPDVVVAEAQLSSGKGFQLMQMVKSRPEVADIPVVLLSRESFLDSIYATYAAIRSAGEHEAAPASEAPAF